MKKFLIIAISLGLLVFAAFYGSTRYGFYIDWNPDAPVTAQFTIDGKKILHTKADGTGTEFVIKGVDISASMPGHSAADFAADKEDYLRWFGQIGEMGANAIRAVNVMDDDFYNSLYEYNTSGSAPLYLLQGTTVPDAANYGEKDACEDEFMGQLIQDGRELVDIIHGNRIITTNRMGGTGRYHKDISPWVIGFLVGTEWSADTIAYTNQQSIYSGSYQGTYFFATEDAQPFEAMAAEVMDGITSYESKKYKEQRPIGFINDPANDPFEYTDTYKAPMDKFEKVENNRKTYARQLSKLNQIDAEHVKPTEDMKAGCFAAYRLYEFCPDFYEYFSEEEKERLGDMLTSLETERSYDGYLELLGRYHTMPVIGAGYGFSTSRGIVSETGGAPLTEKEQGERLAAVYKDMRHAGWSGGFITSWQDQWERRSWNTAYAQDTANNMMWKDVQTDGQGYGLMEFTASSCTIDGDASEWRKEDVVTEQDGIRLSARVDEEGLCLLAEGEKVTPATPLYIPLDITPESGSTVSRSPELSFSRPADFLLSLGGEEESRLLVQARYESVRENFLREISGEDPFIAWPETDEPSFLPVSMVLENKQMVDAVTYENKKLKLLPTWETGRLRHGNQNPEAEEYDSLADFCYGSNLVEVRIPWLLLNFSNPAKRMIHEDYYENYGVKSRKIKNIWLGITAGEGKSAEMEAFRLKWKLPAYEERLKQSYQVVQSVWR